MALQESIAELSIRPADTVGIAEPESVARGRVPDALARARYERFVTLFESLVTDVEVAERLATAGVSVRIELDDVPDMPITLLLRLPAGRLVRGLLREPPDVRLVMRSSDLIAVFQEAEHLPMQILSGRVRFEGCVRKFLRVLPILRAGAG